MLVLLATQNLAAREPRFLGSSLRPLRHQENARLIAAVQNARINPLQSALQAPKLDLPDLEDIETTTPLELILASCLELLLEFSTKYITLGPLYSITQPLAVLKTRAFYRMVQTPPKPRIAEASILKSPVSLKSKCTD